MNKHLRIVTGVCLTCGGASDHPKRCAACTEEAGRLVGEVIWKLVEEEVRRSDDGQRIIHMLAGFQPAELAGIAVGVPQDGLCGRSVILRVKRSLARGTGIDPAHLTDEGPVHWRHSEEADVIVFAPEDGEREAIGASLGPIRQIDRSGLMDRVDLWMPFLNETGEARTYLRHALEGLRASGACIDLAMFVDFVRLVRAQGFSRTVERRLQHAAPALEIPVKGLVGLPAYKEGKPAPSADAFRKAFRQSHLEVREYVYLQTAKQERVNLEAARENATELAAEADEDVTRGLDAAIALIEDALNVRHGDWRPSQSVFCREAPWDTVGQRVFAARRSPGTKKLGERTLEFIELDYAGELTEDDRKLLETMDSRKGGPTEDEQEFFERWQDRLNTERADNLKIFREWHKRLFHKEIVADDLISALAEGFEALMIAAGGDIDDMQEPGIVVSASHKDRGTFWRSLDRRVHALFRFELRCVQGLLTAPRVVYDLDNALKLEATDDQTSATKRRVELELYLVDLAGRSPDDRSIPRGAPRVKAVWQPGRSGKATPVSLALPEDLADLAAHAGTSHGRLFPRQSFTPRSHLSQRDKGAVTLADTTTFSDVAHAQNGRTVDHEAASTEDLLEDARRHVERLCASHSLTEGEAAALVAAMERFRSAFAAAVSALVSNPAGTMAGDLLQRQADAFGELCRTARLRCTSSTARSEIRSRIARIGVIPASGGEAVAILAAWHPLRLAERRAKIAFLAQFIEKVLGSSSRGADLNVAYDELRQLVQDYRYPEAAFLDDATYVAVETVNGASLLVPAAVLGQSAEALEQSARSAAQKFSEGVDEYLEVHPHEAANLSAAIYNSESASLPREFAHRLADKIRRDPGLRCDLLITHHNQKKMRTIYEQQNVLLAADNMAENTRGVLSRLRVGVVPSTSDDDPDGERDIDLVLLHEAISRAAKPVWDLEPACSEELDPAFDVRAGIRPRRRLAEADASGSGIYLTIPRPPRSVADYYDLLYAIDKDGYVPQDKHAVLTRAVSFDDGEVRETIERAHRLGEWVLTFDQIANRQVFEAAGVQIIRDVTLPDSQSRVLISALSAGAPLKRRLATRIEQICDVDAPDAQRLCDLVLSRVIEVSGQKILGAARYENATVEMVGLYVARAILERALPDGAQPIWISLDDYRRWFTTGSGKIADIVGVTIIDRGAEGFLLKLQVGEAKCIGAAAAAGEMKDALQQVRDTAQRLRETLVDNADPISRAAWCSRLASLLVMRDGLSLRIPKAARRGAFLDAMNRGDVAFELSGEAVLCVHDDDSSEHRCVPDETHRHLRAHLVPRARIRSALLAARDGRGYDGGPQGAEWLRGRGARATTGGEDEPAAGTRTALTPPDPTPPPPVPSAGDPDGPSEDTGTDDPIGGAAGDPPAPQATATADERGGTPAASPAEPDGFIPAPVRAVLEEMRSRESGSWEDEKTLAWVESLCIETQRALSQFGMQPEFADPKYRLTPNGALISFRGHPTLTVDRIEKRRMELLTTYGLNVIDVRPGRGRISLFIAREERMPVPLASTWLDAAWPEGPATSMTSFILGIREDDGSALWLNFEGEFAGYAQHGPHTLIAGGTGSGKGVLTQSIILQIISFNDPRHAELLLIDPKKGVDFAWLKGAPHLRRPIVTDVAASRAVFNELVALMDERYEMLERAGVPNISEFNATRAPADRLARVFVIHDEMGAWMAEHADYSEAVVGAVASLAMKGRAAGIHLTLITQRADVKAVPGALRDNMGNRLCLKVQNATGSGMVLGHGGAEKLLGRGHLAAALDNQQPPAGQQHFVLQVPFAATPDIARLAQAAITHWSGRSG